MDDGRSREATGPTPDVGVEGTRFPRGDGCDSEVEALRATREEARAILEYELRSLDELDDKAMRTVRTAVVVLGLILSVLGVTGPASVAGLPIWQFRLGALGVGFLVVAVLVGMVAATDTAVQPGPDAEFRREARTEAYTEREWLVIVLSGYDEWIETAKGATARNASRLLLAQVALVCAFLSLLAAVGLSVMPG